jgi:Domain of unknown function (DUF4062)
VDVFVSSTYRDLAEYREVLRVALTTSGHTFQGMEHFAANPTPPLETCMAALSGCNVYVGLIGSLYGSSPPGRRLSYTELEYRRAMDRDMYAIILLLDDAATVRQSLVERDPERLQRLERFKSLIRQRHTVQTFRDPHEAAWKILAALRVYEVALREREDADSL